jgi:hypothetical protein
MTSNQMTLNVDAELAERLAREAARLGLTTEAHIADILKSHLDEQAARAVGIEEDDRRWQRYRETGQTVSEANVRHKLQRFADDAQLKANSR